MRQLITVMSDHQILHESVVYSPTNSLLAGNLGDTKAYTYNPVTFKTVCFIMFVLSSSLSWSAGPVSMPAIICCLISKGHQSLTKGTMKTVV